MLEDRLKETRELLELKGKDIGKTLGVSNKTIYGYENNYKSFKEFSNAIKEYIDYYNNERIQAKTKWMPPVQYRIASMCSA